MTVIPFPPPEDEPEPGGQETHYEVELGDEPGKPEPVHEGEAVAALPPDEKRRDIIPPHLRTLAGVRKAIERRGGAVAYEAGFQAVRAPLTIALWAVWAIWGVLVLAERLRRWWFFTEQATLRSHAVITDDSREHRALVSQGRNVRRDRGYIIGAAAFGVLLAGSAVARFAPWWAWILIGLAALPFLARAGRPAGRPLLTPSLITPRFRVISADVVLRAYYAAGLGSPDKAGQEVTFGSPMSRDGDGSRVAVDLPYGKGLDDAVRVKPAIASGLDVSLSQVFIHRDPSSHRRHVLWVADRDPLASPVGHTPLLACRQTDIWQPATIGLDERGAAVKLAILWNSILAGALPRQGKSFFARLLALYCALDPYVKLDVFDASGKPDWRKFALVADSYAFGLTPTRDGKPPEILLETLIGIKEDVQDRYNRLSELDPKICPEGKLTRQIARDPRFRMPVRVVVLDEFQEYFILGKISADIAELITFLVKVAPAAGVSVILATQKPSGIGKGDIGQQFTQARDQCAVRFSLRTASYSVSEAVLGQGAYGEGLDSSTLLPEYKGVGILRGATDASPTVRTYLADAADAEKILRAARTLRQRAGTLSGMAAGLDVGRDDRDVLADVLQVFGGDSGLHWAVLAGRLAAQIPDRWADTSPDAVSAECRALGVPSVGVKMLGTTLKGCRQRDIQAARAEG